MLTRIRVEGFKSLKEIDLELRELNVLIGANGAGKSNFVSFFELLKHIYRERLAKYVSVRGGASSFLYYGPKFTDSIRSSVVYDLDVGSVRHCFELAYGDPDRLVFTSEEVEYTPDLDSDKLKGLSVKDRRTWEQGVGIEFESGFPESKIPHKIPAQKEDAKKNVLRQAVEKLGSTVTGSPVYHFRDTTRQAKIRQKVATDRSRYLFANGGNLAAVLFRLKCEKRDYYDRIVRTIRQVAPFFDDFDFPHPGNEPEYIQLDWHEKGEEYPFGPHQLSDGTLRAMALITLLFQPEDDLPNLIILDEPELGFHPHAIRVLGGLLQHAVEHAQVLVATQSPILVDQFETEDLVIANREGKATKLQRPDSQQLKSWLEEYTLSELWEKNVLGGTP